MSLIAELLATVLMEYTSTWKILQIVRHDRSQTNWTRLTWISIWNAYAWLFTQTPSDRKLSTDQGLKRAEGMPKRWFWNPDTLFAKMMSYTISTTFMLRVRCSMIIVTGLLNPICSRIIVWIQGGSCTRQCPRTDYTDQKHLYQSESNNAIQTTLRLQRQRLKYIIRLNH